MAWKVKERELEGMSDSEIEDKKNWNNEININHLKSRIKMPDWETNSREKKNKRPQLITETRTIKEKAVEETKTRKREIKIP